ncbi:MAG TPA: cysteine--tRNA ligase [Opitutaceae bacterium]|jgi:cysteinyl-tRNA synthetase|nr:cysteine--tRNA ligase [Opitutaceae bacterium]
MPIKLFDSLTREIRELRRPDPNNPKDVFSFYNCGPTVYAPAHIGNFRTFVVNDVLRRLLELEYGKDKVRYVRNLTDVDDKTIKRARDEGRPLADVTKQWTQKFHDDCARLNCLPVSEKLEPTATGYIREQVDMIDVLMKKGNAYRAPDGSVYFKVSSFPDYGTLSRVKERELKTGSAFAADADEKEDLSDFALWKAHKTDDGDNAWDSPWGRGRPGWHIECSAMSKALLGDTIDLHTGGVDLLFPHHENEIAQSECCNGTKFSRHWYHSEHLLVDGKKMSKSLGNLYTLDDLTAKGFSPMALRYALLMGHPRKQLNFKLDSLHAAGKAILELAVWHDTLKTASEGENALERCDVFDGVFEALSNDLNTPAALGVVFSVLNNLPEITPGKMAASYRDAFDRMLWAFGIEPNQVLVGLTNETAITAPAAVTALAEKRWAAKKAKDFAGADALRKELTAAGWSMLDGKDGYKLEPIKK